MILIYILLGMAIGYLLCHLHSVRVIERTSVEHIERTRQEHLRKMAERARRKEISQKMRNDWKAKYKPYRRENYSN